MSKSNIIPLSLVLLMTIGVCGSCSSKKGVQGSAQVSVESADIQQSDSTDNTQTKQKKQKKQKKLTYNRLLQSNDYNLKYQWALDYYAKKKNDRVITLMEDVNPYFSGTPQEDTVLMYTGISLYRQGDFESSSMMFDNFRKRFSRSPFIEEAEYLYAMGFYYGAPGPERDQSASIEGITAFNEYLQRYPETHRKEECEKNIVELTQKLYDKALLNAKLYYDIGQYKAAVYALKLSLKDYPETPHREELLFLITKSAYILAERSVHELQHTRYLDMIDAYYNLISEFPETKHKKETMKMYQQAQKFVKSVNKDTTESAEKTENKTDNITDKDKKEDGSKEE